MISKAKPAPIKKRPDISSNIEKSKTTNTKPKTSPASQSAGTAHLRDLCDGDKAKVAKLVAQVTTLTSENDELRKRVEDMTREQDNKVTLQSNEELARNLLEAVEENRILETKRVEALRLLVQYQEKMSHLVNEARLSRRLAAEANSEYAAARDEVHRLEGLVRHQRGSIEALRSGTEHLVVMEDDLRTCKEQLRNKIDEMNRLEQKYNRIDSNAKFLAKQLDELLPELTHKNERIRSLEQQLQLTASSRAMNGMESSQYYGNLSLTQVTGTVMNGLGTYPASTESAKHVMPTGSNKDRGRDDVPSHHSQLAEYSSVQQQSVAGMTQAPRQSDSPTSPHDPPDPPQSGDDHLRVGGDQEVFAVPLRASIPTTLPTDAPGGSHPLRMSFPLTGTGAVPMGDGERTESSQPGNASTKEIASGNQQGISTTKLNITNPSHDEELLRDQYNRQFMSMWGDLSLVEDDSPRASWQSLHGAREESGVRASSESDRSYSLRQVADTGSPPRVAGAVYRQSLPNSQSPKATASRETRDMPFSSSITTISGGQHSQSQTTGAKYATQQHRAQVVNESYIGLDEQWNFFHGKEHITQEGSRSEHGHTDQNQEEEGVDVANEGIRRPPIRSLSPPPPRPPPTQNSHYHHSDMYPSQTQPKPLQNPASSGAFRSSRETMTDSTTIISTPPRGKASPQRTPVQSPSWQYAPPPPQGHNMRQHTIAVQTTPTLRPARRHTEQGVSVSWAETHDTWREDGRERGTMQDSRNKRKGKSVSTRARPRVTRPVTGPFRHEPMGNKTTSVTSTHRPSKITASSQQLAARSLMTGNSSVSLSKKYSSAASSGGGVRSRHEVLNLDLDDNSGRPAFSAGVGSPGLTAWDVIREDYGGDSMMYGSELFELVDELEDVPSFRGGESIVIGNDMFSDIR